MTIFKSEKSKIYVIAGGNEATGGPELIYQLVYNMWDLGFDAYMYYIPDNHPNPVHPSYKFYKNPYANLIKIHPKDA